MENSGMLDEIMSVMGDAENSSTTPILLEDVLRWMRSDDIEVLGAAYALISDKRHYMRIQPSPSLAHSYEFLMCYFERCLLENPDGQWSNSRYEAGWDVVNWFADLWRDQTVPRKMLHKLKEWLARLYKEGDDALRACLVNATFEHLFEDHDIAKYFANWQKDPILGCAYRDGMLWSQKGGTSPLGKHQ